jgi:ribosomal protein L11 methyltransferase
MLEIAVPVDGEAAEAVCELFERYGGGAVVEVRMRDSTSGHDLAAPEHWVRTYLAADDVEARQRVEVGLWYLSRIHPIPEAAIRQLAEANWAEAWKSHYEPLRIGGSFLIVPSWIETEKASPQAGDRIIRLDPGMAFGTGLHPSTRLCLSALEARLQPGDRMLDVGTGSGILAIGAWLLGGTDPVGVDIDPKAVEIARENAILNDMLLDARAGGIEAAAEDAPFDLVVANILAHILIELAPALAERCRPGGLLIASGVLDEQASDVAAAFEAAGFAPAEIGVEGDWVVLCAHRQGDPVALSAYDADPSQAAAHDKA